MKEVKIAFYRSLQKVPTKFIVYVHLNGVVHQIRAFGLLRTCQGGKDLLISHIVFL